LKKITRSAQKKRNEIVSIIHSVIKAELVTIFPFINRYEEWQSGLLKWNGSKDALFIEYVISTLDLDIREADIQGIIGSITSSLKQLLEWLDQQFFNLSNSSLKYESVYTRFQESVLENNISTSLSVVQQRNSFIDTNLDIFSYKIDMSLTNDNITSLRSKLLDDFPPFFQITRNLIFNWDDLVKSCYAYNTPFIVEFSDISLRNQVKKALKKDHTLNAEHIEFVARYLEKYLIFVSTLDKIHCRETEDLKKVLSTIETYFVSYILNPFLEVVSFNERNGYPIISIIQDIDAIIYDSKRKILKNKQEVTNNG